MSSACTYLFFRMHALRCKLEQFISISDQALLTMAIHPGYGFLRTKTIKVPLENDRHLCEAARVARVEEAARVATAASIRTKREAKERSAKKRQEVKERAKLNK